MYGPIWNTKYSMSNLIQSIYFKCEIKLFIMIEQVHFTKEQGGYLMFLGMDPILKIN